MEISEGEDAGPSEGSSEAAHRRNHGAAERAAGGGGSDIDNPEWVGVSGGDNPSEAPSLAADAGGRGGGGRGSRGGGSRGFRSNKGDDNRSRPVAHRNFYDGEFLSS